MYVVYRTWSAPMSVATGGLIADGRGDISISIHTDLVCIECVYIYMYIYIYICIHSFTHIYISIYVSIYKYTNIYIYIYIYI